LFFGIVFVVRLDRMSPIVIIINIIILFENFSSLL